MPKIFLVFILYCFPVFIFAQKTGSLTIISDSSVPLIFYLDNVKQNDSPVSQIRIEGLTDMYYRLRAVHKDTNFVSRNLLVGGEDGRLVDATYRIRKLSTGKTKVTLYAMFSPNPNFKGPKSLYVTKIKLAENNLVEIPTTPHVDTIKISKQQNPIINSENNKIVKVVKENKKIKTEGDKKTNNNQQNFPVKNSKIIPSTPKEVTKNKTEVKNQSQVKQASKPIINQKKCNGWPITKKDFELLKKTILESKSESLKLKNAKLLITGSCFLVNQIDEITALLKTEESKLEFVKFAYSFTIDRPNYPKLEKFFSDKKNKEEFLLIHGE